MNNESARSLLKGPLAAGHLPNSEKGRRPSCPPRSCPICWPWGRGAGRTPGAIPGVMDVVPAVAIRARQAWAPAGEESWLRSRRFPAPSVLCELAGSSSSHALLLLSQLSPPCSSLGPGSDAPSFRGHRVSANSRSHLEDSQPLVRVPGKCPPHPAASAPLTLLSPQLPSQFCQRVSGLKYGPS